MAQFKGTIYGGRGETSRLGHKNTGLRATICGWDDGVTVNASWSPERGDIFEIWSNGGSNGSKERVLIATIIGGEIVRP